jgi:hypothetical protein
MHYMRFVYDAFITWRLFRKAIPLPHRLGDLMGFLSNFSDCELHVTG